MEDTQHVPVLLSPSSITPFFDTDSWTPAKDASQVPC